MRRETVRPRKADGKPLTVKDRLGRPIPYNEGKGVELPFSTTLSRLCKEGDLEIKIDDKFVDVNKWRKERFVKVTAENKAKQAEAEASAKKDAPQPLVPVEPTETVEAAVDATAKKPTTKKGGK